VSKHLGRKWTVVLQVLISAGLIVFVFLNLDMSQVKSLALHPQRAPMLAAAFIAFNLSKIVGARRLNRYLRHAAVHLGEGENLRLYYAGMFLNLFLPGGIGGDGYKVLVLHRRHALPLRSLVTITLADRVGGMLILLLILCMLVPMLSLPWHAAAVIVFTASSVTAIVAVFVLAHRWLLRFDVGGIASVFASGMAVQFLQLICMGMLLAYLGAPAADYLAYLAMFLMSSIAAVLPLSVGGLGVREATFLFGVGMFRLDPTYGVIASSWFFLITAVSSMIGALFLGRFSLRSVPAK
jgi:uncharacterized membrane protein YbhN (UPF0104 family)